MNSRLPRVAVSDVGEYLSNVMAERGFDYAESGRVDSVDWDARAQILVGMVRGSGANRYSVSIDLERPADPDDFFAPVDSLCSCPVGADCKHVGAVLYAIAECDAAPHSFTKPVPAVSPGVSFLTTQQFALGDGAGPDAGAGAGTPGAAVRPVDEWRAVLGDLQARRRRQARHPDDADLAVGFEVSIVTSSRWFHARRKQPLGSVNVARLDQLDLTMLDLSLRPMRRGARSKWIKGNLGWRNFVRDLAAPAGVRRDHAAALAQLNAQNINRSYTYGSDPDTASFSSFDPSLIWLLLHRLTQAGVELTGCGVISDVRVLSEHSPLTLTTASGTETEVTGVDVTVDIVRRDGGFELTALIDAAGTVADSAFRIGETGVAILDRLPDNTLRLTLAQTSTPISEPLGALIARGAPITVPDADAEEFFTEFLPELCDHATLTSHDDSFEPPVFAPPKLHLQVAFGSDETAVLSWSWEYYGPQRRLSIRPDRFERRETACEQEALDAVRRLWPTAAQREEEQLAGLQAAQFAVRVLPGLEDSDNVVVEIIGERPEYVELTSAPHVRVTTEETDDRDWFDLGFEVTIDGRRIPFATLFAALASHQTHLLLTDLTYFSLDHPAFDGLRALLREAEALGEWDPERSKISRHQISIWDDLVELADEAVPARAWQESIGKLTSLTELPAPPVPDSVDAQLRGYQIDGFQWLVFLWENGLGGILADDMGLGKTLQTLALIAYAREQVRAGNAPAPEAEAPFLVVAPSSVVSVWQAETARFTPDLTVAVLDTTTHKRKQSVAEAIAGADVVLTSYTIFRINSDEFTELPWGGFILDEAQFVKNQAAKTYRAARDVDAAFTLAITGTPMENSLTDLWSLLSLTAPGLFASPVKFREEYVKPIEKGAAVPEPAGVALPAAAEPSVQEKLDTGRQDRLARLRRRVRPFMLRRTKDLVASELPPKQEQVAFVPLDPKHKRLYDRVLQRERKKVLGMVADLDKHRMTVFRSLTLLRMLALSPQIVDEAYADVPSSKIDALFAGLGEIITEGHRVIVFSQFTSGLGLVAERLSAAGIDYSYLDGSTTNRAEVIDGFRTGTAPVFLISLKAGGFGLTLTEADYVFLLDPWWNPAAESQAIDRAHRIGQTKSVMVYRMVAAGTIEEKVLALQQKKARLFDALMDDGRAFSTGLTADDVRELFAATD